MSDKYYKVNFKLGFSGANGDAEREAFVVAEDWNGAAEKVEDNFVIADGEGSTGGQTVTIETIELINSTPDVFYGETNKSKQTILV